MSSVVYRSDAEKTSKVCYRSSRSNANIYWASMLSKQGKAPNSDLSKNRKAFNSFPLNRKSGQNVGSVSPLIHKKMSLETIKVKES